MSRKECKFQLESCFFNFFCIFQNFINFLVFLFFLVLRVTFIAFVCEVKLQYFSEDVSKLLVIKLKMLEVVPKVCCCIKKTNNLNLVEAAGVQGLVEVEEDLLVDHLLELETLEGRPELYAQDVTEDLDCWGVSHNQ